MILFGILMGVGIAFVKENTNLASDTVIGVFFAGAIGLGSVMMRLIGQRKVQFGNFEPERFLLGHFAGIQSKDTLLLAYLTLTIALFFLSFYNASIFTSLNRSLARSRLLPVNFVSYMLIVLLALTVNICLKVVGLLLVNGLLIVPAACAMLAASNLRQYFWVSVAVSLGSGLLGVVLPYQYRLPLPGGRPIGLEIGGTVVILNVLTFILFLVVRQLWARRSAPPADLSLKTP
jgi:zinc transport system permease protein